MGSEIHRAAPRESVHNIDALACPCGGPTSTELIEGKRGATAQLVARGLLVEYTFLPGEPPPPAAAA